MFFFFFGIRINRNVITKLNFIKVFDKNSIVCSVNKVNENTLKTRTKPQKITKITLDFYRCFGHLEHLKLITQTTLFK